MAAQDLERIEWSSAPDLPGIELLLAERCTRRWHVFHETYTVCTLLNLSGGDTEWRYRGRLHKAKAGQLMLMEPGEVHANTRPKYPPCDFRVVLVPARTVEDAALELGMRRPQWRSGHAVDPALHHSFARLHASLERHASRLERESRFVACIGGLLERHGEGEAPSSARHAHPGLLRAREFIREHYSRPVALGELSGVSGLSRFHLVREFAKEFGLPPHSYQLCIQAQKARAMLTAGISIAMAAAETGFADQSHLTRHFRQVFGVTPAVYVRRSAARAVSAAPPRSETASYPIPA